MADTSCKTYPAKGWRAPSTKSERRKMREKHGAKCFLRPKELKYPVCTRRGNLSCGGLLAAKRRAAQYDHPKLAAKADRMAKKLGCCWAK